MKIPTQILITGSTAGIGRAAAEQMAAAGASVIVHGRARLRVNRAIRAIRAATGSTSVHGIVADLSDREAVEALAVEAAERFPGLDAVVHNAATVPLTRTLTPQGFEEQFFVNHLASCLLSIRLLSLLRANAPARIVFVASQLEREGRIDFDDLQSERGYDANSVYATTKLANVLVARVLARRLEGSGVTVNSLHPGIAGSSVLNALSRNPRWMAAWTRYRQPKPDSAARSIVHLTRSPAVAGSSGCFFHETARREASSRGRDDELAEKLWLTSCALMGVSPDIADAEVTRSPIGGPH